MRRPRTAPRCRECRTKLNRDEALYNQGECENCIQARLDKAEEQKTHVKDRATLRKAAKTVGYDPTTDRAIRTD